MNIEQPADGSDWLGREQSVRQGVDPLAVASLAATLDLDHAPAVGDALPPGWHWLFFNPIARTDELAADGHPRRDLAGSFLPPIPLPRRMWAGSRIRYLAPLRVGAEARRHSRIARIEPKEGRTGRMCFVTVEHTVVDGAGRACIAEQQDIVYRESTTPATPPPAGPAAVVGAEPWRWRKPMRVGPTLLFRYSALTFNGHRIHYDLPYAREVEGYAGLVVHGPLSATLLQAFAAECRPQAPLDSFEFRGVSPLFADEAFELQAQDDTQDAGKLRLRIVGADGRTIMQATAGWRAE